MAGFTTRPEIRGTFGVVASTHWIASAVGMSILEKGGNAFDAAAAAGFTLQVVEPDLNGPLGEAPILVWSEARERCEMICGQGVAPQAATIAKFRDLGLDLDPRHRASRRRGPGALSVPGCGCCRITAHCRSPKSSARRSAMPKTAIPRSAASATRWRRSLNSFVGNGRVRPRSICLMARHRNPAACSATRPWRDLPPRPCRSRRWRPQFADRACPAVLVRRLRRGGGRPFLPLRKGAGRVGTAAWRPVDRAGHGAMARPGRDAPRLRLP